MCMRPTLNESSATQCGDAIEIHDGIIYTKVSIGYILCNYAVQNGTNLSVLGMIE